MFRFSLISCAMVLLSLLSGCGRKTLVISALEDINVETDNRLMSLGSPIDSQRSMNISSTLPFAAVGEHYQLLMGGLPSQQVGMVNDGPDHSRIVEVKYDFTGDIDQLHAVRTAILKMREETQALILEKLRLTLAKNELAGLKLVKAADVTDAQTARLTALQGEIKTRTVKVKEKEASLAKAKTTVTTSVNKDNLLVVQWTRKSENEWAAALGNIFTGQLSTSEQRSGFAILGGLRIQSLHVGGDLHQRLKKWGKPFNLLSWFDNEFIVTHLWQTKHMLSLSEFENAAVLKAHVKATYSQLRHLTKTLKDLDQIEIDALISSATNLSNVASITDPKRTVKTLNWDDMKTHIEDSDGWGTLMVVHTDLHDLRGVSENAGRYSDNLPLRP